MYLPEPEGPTNAIISPLFISKFVSLTASMLRFPSLNDFVTFSKFQHLLHSYPIAFNGSIFLIVKMENKLPNTETIINTIANTSNVSTSNLTGTASGKNAPVTPVNSKPNAVPNNANMSVCEITTFAK